MAKKPLSDKVCQRRLTKWIEENYNELEQETMAYYNDVMDDNKYSFVYDNLVTGHKNIVLVIDRHTGEIFEM